MPVLHARLLGDIEFYDDDGAELKLSTRKARALLAFLIAEAHKWHTRERLAGLLWGDRQEAQARHSLTQSLGTIRRLGASAGVNLIETEADRIRLAVGSVTADVQEFKTKAESDPIAASELYAGLFLNDFVSGDAQFEEWADGVAPV